MFDHLTVDVYGAPTVLSAVGVVQVVSPKLVQINVFDPDTAVPVEKAIADCGMNLNPSSDGLTVNVPIPQSTQENRDALVKVVSQLAEKTKARVRKARRKSLDKLKGPAVEGVSEDDVKAAEKQVQKVHDEYIKIIDTLSDAKQQQIQEV